MITNVYLLPSGWYENLKLFPNMKQYRIFNILSIIYNTLSKPFNINIICKAQWFMIINDQQW